ncbi:MAG: protein translocase subunit SecD [Simkaniaceae bacterium]|nr:protein translocase subunit SecD [Simkaniaceae bacterium]
MEKHKRWHTVLIAAVILLTLYNILPTLLYYAKPLNKPIGQKQANAVAAKAIDRVNSLEDFSVKWVKSYCKLLGVKWQNVAIDANNPGVISATFKDSKSAETFKRFLPKAGALIPFYPAQLTLAGTNAGHDTNVVLIQRKIPIHFSPEVGANMFEFTSKYEKDGTPTALYGKLVKDRLFALGVTVGGVSENAQLLNLALSYRSEPQSEEFLHLLAQNINTYTRIFSPESPAARRFFSSFTQGNFAQPKQTVQEFVSALSALKERVQLDKIALVEEKKTLQKRGEYLDPADEQKLETLIGKEESLSKAVATINKHAAVFSSGRTPWSERELSNIDYDLAVDTHNPLIKHISTDWESEKINLELHQDVLALKHAYEKKSEKKSLLDELDQLIINEMARIGRDSQEKLVPVRGDFQISLNSLEGSQSLLAMNLSTLANTQAKNIEKLIGSAWHPEHKDLRRENFPIMSSEGFEALPREKRNLSLVVYSPGASSQTPKQGFRNNSIYVIAKDVGQIVRKFEQNPSSPEAKAFFNDFQALQTLLRENGFTGYAGSQYPFTSEYANDYIFEAEDYFQSVIKATRENFVVHGSKRYATLEFSNVEQRIRTVNTIENNIQEDLLKWRDEYNSSQVDPSLATRFDVPKPTQNALMSNFALTMRKYFRGDDQKVLRWGLDLKGGKTVQVQLRDNNNRVVTRESDLTQGMNELYSRVNKMGVPDVSIRQEGQSITMDFPSAQGLSASELVKASSMSFNVVNEKFSTSNSLLADAVNRFLQDVWNEAIVTGKKDTQSLNTIAWNHLYGDPLNVEDAQPRSEAAKTLFKHGLRLENPDSSVSTSSFNDSVSKIGLFRGDNYSDWHGQSHPLLIVFKNYALEGSGLDDVRSSYDPTKGNYLSFSVKGSQVTPNGESINPRNEFYTWTSTFSKEKIMGTPLEKFSQGRGWRMAVILNGFVVSAPTLDSPLKDSAMISGHFTQREVNRLEADLKAGSLTFTPHILSEKNVSPELGIKERHQGIIATVLALVLVIVTMVGYYRFAGVVASVAVIVNLLIMWAVMQNIGASITLAGIAGAILTLGMAVDANVLVFERIREEFAQTSKLSAAVAAGYKKAFTAIIDSNLTTILAALILLNFDSGPVKGFALTLIIGITSSMFTALFLTKYFFSRWVQNPKNQTLSMANLIKSSNFNFLKWSKLTAAVSFVLIACGAFSLYQKRSTILGMDFTGGNALAIELTQKEGVNYRAATMDALVTSGAARQDINIRELSPSNQLRIFFGAGLDQAGNVFHNMPIETAVADATYSFESNPRLVWLVQALEKNGLELTERSLIDLDKNWTSVSGQMSEAMRNNALVGLGIALICILVYITFRFEFKYAISATLGLGFDVLVTLSILAILNALSVPIQIDLNIVAALMTIVGYSLNDTIIVFDRVREDVGNMRRASFSEIINHALNVTLSRTVMTSLTTLLVLVALVVFGGASIFGFSLIMAIGVVVGTLSSFFISSALLLIFQNREVAQNAAEKSA